MTPVLTGLSRTCRLQRAVVRESLAELLGTAVLVFIGNSVIANNVRSSAVAAVNIPLGYAAGLCVAVFATGGVSGGHVNPAATLALCLTGRSRLSRLVPFTVAQYVGGFVGAALTHALFYDMFESDSERTNSSLYQIFATYPNPAVSRAGAFLDQMLGTALLLFGVLAVTDQRNTNVPRGAVPPAVGLVLYAVIACSGSNTGAALNPARDLAPRLYSYVIGYHQAFSACGHFWWIQVVASYVGASLGAFVYLLLVELHHPASPEPEVPCAPAVGAKNADQDKSRDNAAFEILECF